MTTLKDAFTTIALVGLTLAGSVCLAALFGVTF
jgi:hypothetical protein